MRLRPTIDLPWRTAFLVVGATLTMTAATATDRELSYRTHWLGPAGSEAPAAQEALGLAVAADGTCIISAGPRSAAPAVTFYRDGRLVGRAAPVPGVAHAFTGAVAVSERHVFAAVTIGPVPTVSVPPPGAPLPGRIWHGLWRFTRDGRHAPAPAGRGAEQAFLSVHESGATPGATAAPAITGLWIHDGTVFVSDAVAGRVRAFDETTLEPTRGGFPADSPSGLCVLGGNLQVIERGAVVSAFTLEGQRTGQVLDEGDDLLPGAVAPTPEGRLMVSDLGASQQVHFFNMSGVPTRVRTLGEETGMYGPPAPGEAGPRRFAGLSGVGADASGELYVAMSPPPGGFALRRFAPDRKTLRWQLGSPTLNHGADADPRSDGLDIHSAEGRHALDLARPPGQSWRWVALSVNPFRYPHDARLAAIAGGGRATPAASTTPIPTAPPGTNATTPPPPFAAPRNGTTTFREIDGHKLLAVCSHDASLLSLYRLRGQTAVPAVVIQTGARSAVPAFDPPGRPKDGPWIWRDTNGDGQFETAEFSEAPAFTRGRFQNTPIDARGGLWLTTASQEPHSAHRLCHWPCRGLDDHGIPVYQADPSGSASVLPAAPGTAAGPIDDSVYDPASDTLYQVTPETTASSERRLAVTAGDGWSKNREPDGPPGTPRWKFPLAESFQTASAPSLAVAGSLVFLLNPDTLEIDVRRAATGLTLGLIKPPAAVKTSAAGAPAPALRAHRRSDGSYLVLTQDPTLPRVLVHHLDDPLGTAPRKQTDPRDRGPAR